MLTRRDNQREGLRPKKAVERASPRAWKIERLFTAPPLPQSRTNKTVVLDLDSTLIATHDDYDTLAELGIMRNPRYLGMRHRIYVLSADDVMSKRGNGEQYRFWGVVRPHAEKFLAFCFWYFRSVIVWSAGKQRYVEAIVRHMFHDLPWPDIVWSHGDCEPVQDPDNPDEIILEKPLEKLAARYPKLVRMDSTLIIDDNYTTFAGANPDNGILIPKFDPAAEYDNDYESDSDSDSDSGEYDYDSEVERRKKVEKQAQLIDALSDMSDDAFLKIEAWCMRPEVISAPDVRLLDKSRIFD